MNKKFGVAVVLRLVIFSSGLHAFLCTFSLAVAPSHTFAHRRSATVTSSLDSVPKQHKECSGLDSPAASNNSRSIRVGGDEPNCALRMPVAIRNFRLVGGLDGSVPLYRCGNTDSVLSEIDHDDAYDRKVNEKVRSILIHDAGLVIDLRSKSERNETKAQAWMRKAGFIVQENSYLPTFISGSNNNDGNKKSDRATADSGQLLRTVLRIDLLNPAQFMQYLEENWLSPSEKVQAALWKVVNGDALHRLRMRTLNSRGLLGLNQAILVTGQRDMLSALQAMTLFWEACCANNNVDNGRDVKHSAIVFNCVQGTGLLSMLCQSILLGEHNGSVDHVIVADYHLSEMHLQQGSGSAAAQDAIGNDLESNNDGKLNRKLFSGAPAHVMQDTLAWLRAEYGSVHGYLDTIGFDQTWRRRLLLAVPKRRQSHL